MPVESAADLASFFDPDEFGKDAAVFGGETANGIFDQEYIAVLTGFSDVPIDSDQPRYLCQEADLPSIANGVVGTINGNSFTVRSVQPDGTGLVVLVLEVA